jgi:hypothetical protein
MAKKRSKGAGWGTKAGGVAIVGEVIGNVLGQLLSDGIEGFVSPMQKKQSKKADKEEDLAGRALRVLVDGPKSIPELVEELDVGLSRLLRVLGDVQTFKLVEYVDDGDKVALTKIGTKTAQVVRTNGVKKSASRLLG